MNFDAKRKAVRSRAPMRISFGGGGTEIDPYMSKSGGRVMNATIAVYAQCFIEGTGEPVLKIESTDASESIELNLQELRETDLKSLPRACLLAVASLRYITDIFDINLSNGIILRTSSDAPVGSGLGASSTMTVAIAHALLEYFAIATEPYSLAKMAYQIEREYLGLAGGLQDHFCAAFGGFNYMEFGPKDHLLINPLRVKRDFIYELESSLILLYTGTSRNSAEIIQSQIMDVMKNQDRIEANLKSIADNAEKLKSAILKGKILEFGELLTEGWYFKKNLSERISTNEVELLEKQCKEFPCLGLKLCGAGGGGYMLITIQPERRDHFLRQIASQHRRFQRVHFTEHGSEVWVVK